MTRVHYFGSALLLAVSAGASAGTYLSIEPYPQALQAPQVSTTTRAQVAAELHEAMRLGLMASGMGDFPAITAEQNEMIANAGALASGRVDPTVPGPGATADDMAVVRGDAHLLRAKIHAETVEAARLGLLNFGEGNPPMASAQQEQQIAAAGRRAVEEARLADHVAHNANR